MDLLQIDLKGNREQDFLTKIHDESASVGHCAPAVLGEIPNSGQQRIVLESLPKHGESFPWLSPERQLSCGG